MKSLLEIINDFYSNNARDENNKQQQPNFALLQLILNSLAEGVIVADKNGKFVFFNPVAKEILGLGSIDVDSSEWSDTYGCYYPDTMAPFPSEYLPLARALQGIESQNTAIFIKNPERPNGVYISVSGKPLHDTDGSVQGGTVVFRDITDNMLTLKALRESQDRINAQFDGIPIPTYVWQYKGDDFHLINYNKAAESMTNNSIKKYIGIRLHDMYARSPDIIADFHNCFKAKTAITREMIYTLISTGEDKYLNVRYVFVPPDLIMVHTEDITKRKEAEKDLRQLYNAVEQTGDSVVITNKEGIIEYVNPAFEVTTGYSRDEVIGQTPGILKSGLHDHDFYANLWSTIVSGKQFRGTIINKKKNGELYWSEQTITPMIDIDGDDIKIVSVLKDVTELRKKQEQEFQLRLARGVQQQLYKIKVDVPGYNIAARTHSAVETSGDYFDYFLLPDGTFSIVICDVAGHGIGPALIMSSIRSYLRAFARSQSEPGKLLTSINKELVNDLDFDQYATMVIVRLDFKHDQIDYASAGHLPFFVINDKGEKVRELESLDIPLGIMEDTVFATSEKVQLNKHDMLLFITDGIVEAEAPDRIQFGFKRTLDVVKNHYKESPSNIVEHIYKAVREYIKDSAPTDDITSIVCKMMD